MYIYISMATYMHMKEAHAKGTKKTEKEMPMAQYWAERVCFLTITHDQLHALLYACCTADPLLLEMN